MDALIEKNNFYEINYEFRKWFHHPPITRAMIHIQIWARPLLFWYMLNKNWYTTNKEDIKQKLINCHLQYCQLWLYGDN